MADMKNATMARLDGRAVVIITGGFAMSQVRFVNGPMQETFLVMNDKLTNF